MLKMVIDFPIHSLEVTNQILPGRELFNNSRPGELVNDFPAGDGKIDKTFFKSVHVY